MVMDLKGLYNVSPFVYSCGKTVRNKNVQPHSVSSECCNVFIFVTKGKAVHRVDGRDRILEKGTLEIIPPFFHQVIYAENAEDTEIVYIYFDLFEKSNTSAYEKKPSINDISAKELYFIDKPSCKNAGEYYNEVKLLTEQISASYQSGNEFSAIERKSLMLKLLIIFMKSKEYGESDGAKTSFGYVAKAIRYIEKNMGDTALCAKEVASYIGLNTEYLSKLFLKQIHISLSEHIRNTRISRAKEFFLLCRNVEDVSSKCGFSSVQSFCRTFKAATGVTPTGYIKELEK